MDFAKKFLEKTSLSTAATIALLAVVLIPAYSEEKKATIDATSIPELAKPAQQSKSQDIDYVPYMADVQHRIKASWQPPKGRGTKRVIILFKIDKSGEASNLRIDKPSGMAAADEAASVAIKKASPFQPLPPGAPDLIDIQFTFDYRDSVANLDQPQKALVDLSKAISLDPRNASAYYTRARCYYMLSEFSKAIEDYKKAVILDPENSDATFGWAACQLKLGNNKQAFIDINRFISDFPDNGSAYYVRGRLYVECSQKWKAIADFNKALTLNPFLWQVYYNRADAFSEVGRHDLAVADLAMALRHSPKDAVSYAKLGAEHAKLAEYQLAIEDFRKAFKLDPVSAGYTGIYGENYDWRKGNDRCFFIDKSGKRINKRTFTNACGFSEGLAVVQTDNGYGYVDKSCRFVIKPQFSQAGDFHEGLALITDPNLKNHGYITKSGKLTINYHNYHSQLLFAGEDNRSDNHFSEGLARVCIGSKYGFIKKYGEIAIPPLFDQARPFSDGLAAVEMAGRYGFIDKTGMLVIGPQFDVAGDFSQGLAPVLRLSPSRFMKRVQSGKTQLMIEQSALKSVQNKYGFIDKTGKYVIAPQFEVPGESNFRLIGIADTFDRAGQPVFEIRYEDPHDFFSDLSFSEGLAPVSLGGKYGFIDPSGTIVIQPQFELAGSFADGLRPACVGNYYGYIDKTGKFIIKPQFDSAQQFSEDIAVVEMHDSKKKTKK